MKRTYIKPASVFAVALLCTASLASASILETSSGLASPTQTINFDEFGIPANTSITNQYSSLGVVFSPNLFQSPQTGSGFPNIDDNNLGNFFPIVDPFFIQFSQVQNDVAFAFVTNTGNTTFTTLLGGSVVESAVFTTNTAIPNWYVFNGTFDEIRVDVGGSNNAMLMDNLQLGQPAPGPEPIPEPFSIAIWSLLGALGMSLAWRRRKRS